MNAKIRPISHESSSTRKRTASNPKRETGR